MKVINIFGGPGVGKSTTACGLFVLMKKAGFKVEYADEYAKEKTYEREFNKLNDQLYIFAKQNRKIRKLIDQVDYVITDGPIIISDYYNQLNIKENPDSDIIYDYETFQKFVLSVWKQYDNISILLKRNSNLPYQEFGRKQNEKQAKELDTEIEEYLYDICDLNSENLITFEITDSTSHALFSYLLKNNIIVLPKKGNKNGKNKSC